MSESVKSAERALKILMHLKNSPRGLAFTEICDELGLPKSSAHALLATMVEHRFLVQDAADRRYWVGIGAWGAGNAYRFAIDLEQAALPSMCRIRDRLDETVQLAILDGTENVYVAKVASEQKLVLVSQPVGGRLPAYATGLGKTLLAGLPDDEVRRRFKGYTFQKYTPKTIASVTTLLAELTATRTRGYGTDNGEYADGVLCFAVPIFDSTGETRAAMSVSVPEVRVTESLRTRALEELKTGALEISVLLGFRGAANSEASAGTQLPPKSVAKVLASH